MGCTHERLRGPAGDETPGAYCADCGAAVRCPHPPDERLRRWPRDGGPCEPPYCTWCHWRFLD